MKYLLDGEETKRVRFRKILLSDFNDWLPFFENPLSHQHWEAKLETPKMECEKWYHKQFHRYQNNLGGMNALIEKESGKLIGHCGLLIQTVDNITELEVGYSLLPEFWGKGLATESAKKCREYAFENNLSNSIISIISLTNNPSEKIAIKNGMKLYKVTNYNGNKVNIYRIDRKTDN